MKLLFILSATWWVSALGLSAAAEPSAKDRAFFEAKVRPLLIKHCYECHSEAEDAQKGGLLLDRESGWLKGGDTAKAVVPGNLKASLLIKAVAYTDPDFEMPPKYQLEEREIAILKKWVRDGAAGLAKDLGETAFSQLGDQEVIFEKAKDHWSFQPVKKVDPPKAADPAWNENPIDRFVFAKLEEKGLSPSPAADSRTLLRRLNYRLTGLPPMDLAGADTDAVNYEERVDELLASPRFAEQFARHWLDVARYADTSSSGTKTPYYYPFAFTYRDYVIDSFHEDKPFDQFVREQLAADLMGLEVDDPTLAALGFIAVSPVFNQTGDFVDDAIDVTTRGLLGLTVSCARCHDHKFEPVPTADYYSLFGVFQSLERPLPWEFEALPEIGGYETDSKTLADYKEKRQRIDDRITKAGETKRGNRARALTIRQTDLAELLLFHDGAPARAMIAPERKKPVEPVVLIRGEPGSKGDQVPRRFLKILDPEQAPFSHENSGRLDLAQKIVDPENPLTARVYVNRIWSMLMGDPIVNTPSDFGIEGEAPSHPELLDYLAMRFIEDGWSTKKLVRLVVTSKSFQQSSLNREEAEAVDPENELLWRANRTRVRIEELRDSLLAVSGQLDLRMRGRPGEIWGENYTRRRSIYTYVNRFNLDPTLRNFDFPSPQQTQGSRTENIVSPQALFLMNSPFMIDQMNSLIEEMNFSESESREQRITRLYQRVLQRPPTPLQFERMERFINIEEGRGIDPWPLLAQSLCMSNEFLYID
jgi:hypothetical protein